MDANQIVSPKNTEKLYGDKAYEPEPKAGHEETIELKLPDADEYVRENMFPSAD